MTREPCGMHCCRGQLGLREPLQFGKRSTHAIKSEYSKLWAFMERSISSTITVVLLLSPLSVVGCAGFEFDMAFTASRAASDAIFVFDFLIVRIIMASIAFNWASFKSTEEPVDSARITVEGAVAFLAGITLAFRA